MALQVDIEIGGTGLVLSYWRIGSFSFNALKNETILTLAGYKTQADYVAGKKSGGDYQFRWQGSDNPLTASVIQAGGGFAAIYAKVKASHMSNVFRDGEEPVETNPFVAATDV